MESQVVHHRAEPTERWNHRYAVSMIYCYFCSIGSIMYAHDMFCVVIRRLVRYAVVNYEYWHWKEWILHQVYKWEGHWLHDPSCGMGYILRSTYIEKTLVILGCWYWFCVRWVRYFWTFWWEKLVTRFGWMKSSVCVRKTEQLKIWLPDCIPELVLLHRNGQLSESM